MVVTGNHGSNCDAVAVKVRSTILKPDQHRDGGDEHDEIAGSKHVRRDRQRHCKQGWWISSYVQNKWNINTFPRYLRLESGELLSHDWRIVCCAQLPLYTIVCHAIPRHTIVYHCIQCHTKPYNCIPHCAMSYYVIQHNTTPHGPSHWNTIPRNTMKCHTIPWNITKRHTIPYHHLCDQLPVINWD